MLHRLLALACVLTAPALAQSSPSSTASAPTIGASEAVKKELEKRCLLSVARSGNEVAISWVLPTKPGIKQFEIFRNNRSEPLGRSRVAAVRIDPPLYFDSVPDSETYWYWLKITFVTGVWINVGPVATPDGKVWTP